MALYRLPSGLRAKGAHARLTWHPITRCALLLKRRAVVTSWCGSDQLTPPPNELTPPPNCRRHARVLQRFGKRTRKGRQLPGSVAARRAGGRHVAARRGHEEGVYMAASQSRPAPTTPAGSALLGASTYASAASACAAQARRRANGASALGTSPPTSCSATDAAFSSLCTCSTSGRACSSAGSSAVQGRRFAGLMARAGRDAATSRGLTTRTGTRPGAASADGGSTTPSAPLSAATERPCSATQAQGANGRSAAGAAMAPRRGWRGAATRHCTALGEALKNWVFVRQTEIKHECVRATAPAGACTHHCGPPLPFTWRHTLLESMTMQRR